MPNHTCPTTKDFNYLTADIDGKEAGKMIRLYAAIKDNKMCPACRLYCFLFENTNHIMTQDGDCLQYIDPIEVVKFFKSFLDIQ